jgi:hypothetical protein
MSANTTYEEFLNQKEHVLARPTSEQVPWQLVVENLLRRYQYKGFVFEALAEFARWTGFERMEVQEGYYTLNVYGSNEWTGYMVSAADWNDEGYPVQLNVQKALTMMVAEQKEAVNTWVAEYVAKYNEQKKQAKKLARKAERESAKMMKEFTGN